MDVKKWLDQVAYVDEVEIIPGEMSEVYKSKFDGSYITHVGLEESVKFLADRGITEELTHGVGFSPEENKWYGWSHRAIYGFTIGSTCKKGDCHYVPETPEGLIEDRVRFFADVHSEEESEVCRAECQILEDRSGIRILPAPLKIPVCDSLNELEEAINGGNMPEEVDIYEGKHFEIKCGRGEWVAKTMEDAKQMAIDFNESVS